MDKATRRVDIVGVIGSSPTNPTDPEALQIKAPGFFFCFLERSKLLNHKAKTYQKPTDFVFSVILCGFFCLFPALCVFV